MLPGTEVQFVGGPFGLLSSENPNKFSEHLAEDGDVGVVISPEGAMPEGWLLVRHEKTGLLAPVHPSMISPVS